MAKHPVAEKVIRVRVVSGQNPEILSIKTRLLEKTADVQEIAANEVKPAPFTKAEDKDEYLTLLEQSKATREKQRRAAESAANAILRSAGFKSAYFRRKG